KRLANAGYGTSEKPAQFRTLEWEVMSGHTWPASTCRDCRQEAETQTACVCDKPCEASMFLGRLQVSELIEQQEIISNFKCAADNPGVPAMSALAGAL